MTQFFNWEVCFLLCGFFFESSLQIEIFLNLLTIFAKISHWCKKIQVSLQKLSWFLTVKKFCYFSQIFHFYLSRRIFRVEIDKVNLKKKRKISLIQCTKRDDFAEFFAIFALLACDSSFQLRVEHKLVQNVEFRGIKSHFKSLCSFSINGVFSVLKKVGRNLAGFPILSHFPQFWFQYQLLAARPNSYIRKTTVLKDSGSAWVSGGLYDWLKRRPRC